MNTLWRDMEDIQKDPNKTQRLKKNRFKSKQDEIIRRLDTTKEKVSEFEDMAIDNSHNETQRGRKN